MKRSVELRQILVVNGPAPNRRDRRDGAGTELAAMDAVCREESVRLGVTVELYQANDAAEFVDLLRHGRDAFDGLIVNMESFEADSIELQETVAAVPTVEVQLADVAADRAPISDGPASAYRISGRGIDGYRWALRHLVHRAAWPVITVDLGGPDRCADLRVPEASTGSVAVLFHGGFWRRHWTRDVMDAMAVDLVRRGHVTWNVEYRRIPPIGGWRCTLQDARDGLDGLHAAADRYPVAHEDVLVIGHSAGAQLGLHAATAARTVRPRRVVSLAGALDLEALYDEHDPNNGPRRFLGSDGPSAFAHTSPIERLPTGVRQLIVHGTADDDVPLSVSERYAAAAARAGDDIETVWIEGGGHMDLIDPASAAWAEVVARI